VIPKGLPIIRFDAATWLPPWVEIERFGSSYEQTGDYHLTPLGPMPGSMVVINAIHSLLQRGTPAS
jgi:hypothetical protein